MKILLYDIGSNRKELNEPLGIESIAGNLIQEIEGVKIDFIWELLEPLEINNINSDYDLIGVSAKLGTLEKLEKLLSFINNDTKSNKIIIGGPLSTFGYIELLTKHENIICVRGEGESSFVELCKAYKESNWGFDYFKNIPNIAFIYKNKLFETKRKAEDLSKIRPPYRYYLNDVVKHQGIVRIENSRGCSWSKCDFCSVSEHYGIKYWRPFPISLIIQQLKELSENGCLSPYFTDEDFFGGDYSRASFLAEEIIKEKNIGGINPVMNFYFSVRMNDVVNEEGFESIKKWKEAGLREIFIGLESGVQKQLKRYGKPATPNKNAKVINILKGLGIQLDIGYILFDPEMSFDELIENIRYIRKERLFDIDSRSVKKIRAQPFTKTTNKYFEKGIINGNLNLDLLYYPLKYKDSLVFDVLNMFEEWESILADEIYSFQAESRGEVSSELDRIYVKKEISKIRYLDYSVLLKIIEYIQKKFDYSTLIQFKRNTLEKKIEMLENARNNRP